MGCYQNTVKLYQSLYTCIKHDVTVIELPLNGGCFLLIPA